MFKKYKKIRRLIEDRAEKKAKKLIDIERRRADQVVEEYNKLVKKHDDSYQRKIRGLDFIRQKTDDYCRDKEAKTEERCRERENKIKAIQVGVIEERNKIIRFRNAINEYSREFKKVHKKILLDTDQIDAATDRALDNPVSVIKGKK